MRLIDFCLFVIQNITRNELGFKAAFKPISAGYLINTGKHNSDNLFTLVLQGPIPDESTFKFLENNLGMYRNNFKDLKIIISSYYDSEKFLNKLSHNLFDDVCLQDSHKLANNFQRQVSSSSLGIEYSSKYNRDFILKMRIDQKMASQTSFNQIREVLESYKTVRTISGYRVVASSLNSWAYRPLGLSDMFIAGTYMDLKTYWSFDKTIVNYNLDDIVPNLQDTWLNGFSLHFESFLAARFMAVNGFRFSKSLFNDSYLMWKDFAAIVDSYNIEQTWKKRNPLVSGNSLIKFSSGLNNHSLLEMSQADWKSLILDEIKFKEDIPNITF
jgi:hypothetical protein